MSEFKTKLWYAGGPTWRPSRGYSAERQHQILETMFGATNPNGPVIMPDGSSLYVGYRNKSLSSYTTGHKPNRKGKGFGLFTPSKNTYDKRPIFKSETVVRPDGDKQETYAGFVPQAFRLLLLLGRHSLQEHMAGEKLPFMRVGNGPNEAARLLTDTALWDVFHGDPDGNSELWLGDFYDNMEKLLGPYLAQFEFPDHQTSARGFEEFGLEEKPFERFTVDMLGRVTELMR